MKIQMQVLQVLVQERKKMSVQDIQKLTKLRQMQVYDAIYDLERRSLILKHRFVPKIGKNFPPSGTITVEAHPKNITRCIRLVSEAEENDE